MQRCRTGRPGQGPELQGSRLQGSDQGLYYQGPALKESEIQRPMWENVL